LQSGGKKRGDSNHGTSEESQPRKHLLRRKKGKRKKKEIQMVDIANQWRNQLFTMMGFDELSLGGG
jgi:hypothetical protein